MDSQNISATTPKGRPLHKARKRALIADLPRGVSVFKDFSGRRKDGTKKEGYRVRLGKKFTGQDKPHSEFVPNLDEARRWIAAQKPHTAVMQATQLNPDEIRQTLASFHVIREKGSDLSLLEAVELALRYHDPAGGRRTIAEVAKEMIARSTKRGAKDSSIRQMKSLLKGLEDEFGGRLLATVTTTEIEEWLDDEGWAPRTRNNYLNQATQLYGFAIRRRYAAANPCDPIDPALEEETVPAILTPEELRALLGAAVAHIPQMIPFVAVSAFGWIRRSEICQLESSAWVNGAIYVPPNIAKTKGHRHIPVNDTLNAWLSSVQMTERFTPSKNPDVMGDKLVKLAALAKIEIPHNALRHSSISYALASPPERDGLPMVNSTGEIAKHAGNSEQVIVKAYRAPIPEKIAREWWKILP